jgi:hypothetical protein
MTQPKPQIEVLPVDQAPWISTSMILQPGLNWAYRVKHPYNPDNEVIGVMGGTKTTTTLRANDIGKKMMSKGKGLRPFSRPIKSTLWSNPNKTSK